MNTITINHEPVELYKILKFECLVDGGGEAKTVIAAGYVYVNGEVTTQKRKKIYAGDEIAFNGEYYSVELGEPTQQVENQQVESQQPQAAPAPQPPKMKKRSAIKF